MKTVKRTRFSIWSFPYIKLVNQNSTKRNIETDYNEIALNSREKVVSLRPSTVRGTIPALKGDISICLANSTESNMSKSGQKHEPLIEEDRDYDKDVSSCVGISIGVCAAIAGLGGIGAIVMLKALEVYRSDINYLYMACYPFIFPAITGVAMAYKRKMGTLSLHFGVLLLGITGGTVFYVMSVFPLYENQGKCDYVVMEGDCDKPVLVYLYIAFGGLGAAFSLFGLLCTMCACCKASKTIAQRRQHEETKHQQQHQRELEAKKLQTAAGKKSNYVAPQSNGTAKQNGGYDNLAVCRS